MLNHFYRLALSHSSSLLSIGARGLIVVAGFAIAYMIGSRLGAEALGTYALVTQTAMFLSIVAVGGLDLSIVRHFPIVEGRRPYASRSVLRMFGAAFGICLVITVLVFLFGPAFFDLFDEVDASTSLLAILSVIFISRAFTRATSAYLRSQRLYVYSQVVEGLIIPIPVIALLLLGMIDTVTEILLVTAVAGLVAVVIGIGSSLTRTSRDSRAAQVSLAPLYTMALPLWGVAIVKNFTDWYSLSVVGAQLSVAEAGQYRIAFQIASALPIIAIGIFGVFSPQIASAAEDGKFHAAAKLARTATRLSLALALPIVLALLAVSRPLLAFVGPEFVAAQPVLFVLIASQVAYLAAGPSGILLALMGKQTINLALSIAALAIFAVAIPLSAIHFGLIGVAAAITVVIVAQNVSQYLAVRWLLKIDVWSGRYHGGK